mmetsp:Transcript_25608/g.48482  ORF Transcript_25608/g.48482 Transcript_25608/m.48482 type:complete len:634 (+) Transcript_25608:907-2808(+)
MLRLQQHGQLGLLQPHGLRQARGGADGVVQVLGEGGGARAHRLRVLLHARLQRHVHLLEHLPRRGFESREKRALELAAERLLDLLAQHGRQARAERGHHGGGNRALDGWNQLLKWLRNGVGNCRRERCQLFPNHLLDLQKEIAVDTRRDGHEQLLLSLFLRLVSLLALLFQRGFRHVGLLFDDCLHVLHHDGISVPQFLDKRGKAGNHGGVERRRIHTNVVRWNRGGRCGRGFHLGLISAATCAALWLHRTCGFFHRGFVPHNCSVGGHCRRRRLLVIPPLPIQASVRGLVVVPRNLRLHGARRVCGQCHQLHGGEEGMRGAVVVRAQLGILGGRSILSVHLKGIGGRRGKSLRLVHSGGQVWLGLEVGRVGGRVLGLLHSNRLCLWRGGGASRRRHLRARGGGCSIRASFGRPGNWNLRVIGLAAGAVEHVLLDGRRLHAKHLDAGRGVALRAVHGGARGVHLAQRREAEDGHGHFELRDGDKPRALVDDAAVHQAQRVYRVLPGVGEQHEGAGGVEQRVVEEGLLRTQRALQRHNLLALRQPQLRLHYPQLHLLVEHAPADKGGANSLRGILCPRHRVYRHAAMGNHLHQALPRLRVPDANGAVLATRRQHLSRWGEGDVGDLARVPGQQD